MWSSLPLEAHDAMMYILSHILVSERPLYFSMAGLKSLGYLIVQRRREMVGKLFTTPGLLMGRKPLGRRRGHQEGLCLDRTGHIIGVLGRACSVALLLG
jgi:hypothetical protein